MYVDVYTYIYVGVSIYIDTYMYLVLYEGAALELAQHRQEWSMKSGKAHRRLTAALQEAKRLAPRTVTAVILPSKLGIWGQPYVDICEFSATLHRLVANIRKPSAHASGFYLNSPEGQLIPSTGFGVLWSSGPFVRDRYVSPKSASIPVN